MRAEAFAKVNLSLQVRPPDAGGMHPLRSLAQSIDWADVIELDTDVAEDAVTVDGDAPSDETNLAWRAFEAARDAVGSRRPVAMRLIKQIPSAAGLGGGSADAAATLALTAAWLGLDDEQRDALAPALGADVPFCLSGGTQWMEGYGERLTDATPASGFALAVVVPDVRLSTPAVYRRWDEIGGPAGPVIHGRDLPVRLRAFAPLANDLTPAAVSLAPELGDAILDLSRVWGVQVAMSGSGSSLFAFFPTLDEAAGAVAEAGTMRAGKACLPVPAGWRIEA